MKKVIGTILVLALTVACNQKKVVKELKTDEEKVSYAIGMQIGGSLEAGKMKGIDVDVLAQAIAARYASEETLLEEDSIMAIIQDYMKNSTEKAKVENQKASKEFLDKNKEKEGVVTTASGLQYEVIKEGTGAKPTIEDVVKVHYTGTRIDGEEFDSSTKNGESEPVTFPLNGVIPGFTEGIQQMSVGSKYKLYIPSELGYGEQGTQGKIGPNDALIFEIELVEIVDKAAFEAEQKAKMEQQRQMQEAMRNAQQGAGK